MDDAAISADGTRIGWERIGTGPGLVVLHGGARAGHHYRRLAAVLAAERTVYLVDRRGRGRSGPAREGHGIATELADLSAVLAATGASEVFGHSAGAVIALEAARILPIRRLAVYEPPVRLAELLPLDWVPAFEAALAANDSARAMAIFLLGLRMGPAWMPTWLVHLGTRVLMRGERGREMAELLRTLPRDLATAREIPWGPSRYAAIGCPTLLLVGDRTPDYLKQAAASVAAAIPGVTRVDLPSLGHNGPDEEAPERVGAEILRFLRAGRAASAAHG